MRYRGNRSRWSTVRRLAGAVLLIGSTALITLATLTPSGGAGRGSDGPCLLICGDRGLADFLSNVVLFLPLGFSLGLLRRPVLQTAAIGAVISLGVELAQIAVVWGRDANPADLVSNTVGSAIGAMVALSFPSALRVSGSSATRRLATTVAVVLTIAVGTGVLLTPHFPAAPYRLSWTTGGPGYAAYTGDVRGVSIRGTAGVQSGPLMSEVRGLAEGGMLTLDLEAGEPVAGLSHIASVEHGHEDVLFVGARSDDLILRYRTLGSVARLDHPELHLPDALAGVESGERLTIDIVRSGGGFCLRANSNMVCPRFTVASGWVLLQNVGQFSEWLRERVDRLWMLLLCLPIGLWFRPRTGGALWLGIAMAGFIVITALTGLEPIAPGHAVAGAVGFLLGAALQRLAVRSS